MSNKHLSFDNRLTIEENLFKGASFKKIEKLVNKNCSFISREIRNDYITKKY